MRARVCGCACSWLCARAYTYVFMYVCALDKTASGAANCLWPNAMIRLAPHWHAVKRAGIIGFAICTIGYLYLQRIPRKMYVAGHN